MRIEEVRGDCDNNEQGFVPSPDKGGDGGGDNDRLETPSDHRQQSRSFYVILGNEENGIHARAGTIVTETHVEFYVISEKCLGSCHFRDRF